MTPPSAKTASVLKIIPGKKGRDLLRAAEQAVTPEERDKVQEKLEKIVGELEWREFGGGGRVAHSAIGATGDALHLAGEPIVNQGDGLIEMERELARVAGDNFEPPNPRVAAARYFGLPESGLVGWNSRKGKARKRLEEVALLSKILVHQGSGKGEATLVYFDEGIGQHPAAFEATVLSLQQGLKAEIPYLAGQFGHGAGLTLNFSNGGQILIGRRHPDLLADDQDDLVGLTIIRKYKASEVGSVHPAYLYAVDKETGKPVAFEAAALSDPRWHGLRRICIDYELGAPANKVGDQASGGLYYHLDNLLPAPILPYALRDERGSSPQWRYMQGIAARLTARAKGWGRETGKNPINVTGPFRTTVDVTASANDGNDYGTAEVTAWVVKQENTHKGNELVGPARAAETWSLTGQMHDSASRDHFGQKPIELDALKNYLKVNVECDGLTVDAKSEIFTTSRQGTAERRAKDALRDAINSVLAGNPQLRALDQEIKEEALRRATEGTDKELERALSDFQHLFEREVDVRVGRKKRKGKKRRKKGKKPNIKHLDPIAPLHAEPTFLQFRKVVRKRLRIEPGGVASIQLEADAVDGYFPEQEEIKFSTAPDLGSTIRIFARERLTDGRLRVHLRAATSAASGNAVLTATCLPKSSSGPLTDSIDLEIATPASGGGGGATRKEKKRVAPPHRVLWKEDTNGHSWGDAGVDYWTEDTVGEFKDGVALVNGDFAAFRELLDQVGVDQRQAIIQLYVPPVVMSLVSIDKTEKEPPTDDQTGASVTLHSAYKDAALRSVALGSVFTIRRLKKLGFGVGDSDED
jgi:hypothetical protein